VFGGLLFARSLSALSGESRIFESGCAHYAPGSDPRKYHEDGQVADYYRRLVDRVRLIPGVTAAGVVNRLPLSGIAQTGGVEFEGTPGSYDSDWRSATPDISRRSEFHCIGDGYLPSTIAKHREPWD